RYQSSLVEVSLEVMLRHQLFVYFYSRRRRHTRSKRDWSSDVCSSDLSGGGGCNVHRIRFRYSSTGCEVMAGMDLAREPVESRSALQHVGFSISQCERLRGGMGRGWSRFFH